MSGLLTTTAAGSGIGIILAIVGFVISLIDLIVTIAFA